LLNILDSYPAKSSHFNAEKQGFHFRSITVTRLHLHPTLNNITVIRIVILGGTTGNLLIEEALSAKHIVVIYARSPQKLPAHLNQHPDVTIVRGELEDAQALDTALAGGVQAILSALGPSFGNPAGTPIAHGYAAVLSAMRRAGVKRLIPLGTLSIADEHDGRSVVYAARVTAVSLGARSAYRTSSRSGRSFGGVMTWSGRSRACLC
jgi:nucleoside-diphosphate-sugar epimerase